MINYMLSHNGIVKILTKIYGNIFVISNRKTIATIKVNNISFTVTIEALKEKNLFKDKTILDQYPAQLLLIYVHKTAFQYFRKELKNEVIKSDLKPIYIEHK